MTNEEFELVTALAHVRSIKIAVECLDLSVGAVLKDEEHAQMRRTARAWEQRLMESVKIRKAREKGMTA